MLEEMKNLIISAFYFNELDDELQSEQSNWLKISERENSERKSLLAFTNFKQESVTIETKL